MGEGRKTHRCLSRDPGRWRSHQTVGVGGRYGFSESERGTKSQRSFSFPQARVMATIGVTRGLGDHNLKVCSSTLSIKPFLSCFPEVRVYDLTQYEHCPDDVLVLGTDGLWDVTNDSEVYSSGPSSGPGGPGNPPGPWLASPKQQAGFRG